MAPIEIHAGMTPYYSRNSHMTMSIDDRGSGVQLVVRNPEIEMRYDLAGDNHVQITGTIQTGTIVPNDLYYKPSERKHNVYPGSLTIADANGNSLTIAPTGQGGYTVHASPDEVRVNSKMNETIREHTARCLAYVKPKPAPELES